MEGDAIFPRARLGAGMYESFYLRAVSPSEPVGVWIRYTVHKAPGRAARGSIWCTVFDARRGAPHMEKLTTEQLAVPPGGWIAVGDGRIGPGHAEGACGGARWSLRVESSEPALRHLSPEWLYRAPLPRTKLTSPAPAARFVGVLELSGRPTLELAGWRGMVGHNWGSEHAERWIWLHGIDFAQQPQAWLDLALGRVRVAGRSTPWLASGAISLPGQERLRLGGLRTRGVQVRESAAGCSVRMPAADGGSVELRATVPGAATAGWRYSDPDGGEHDVLNCSVAALELTVHRPGAQALELRTAHGGAYELGLRERDHGVPIAPFFDG